MFLAGIIFAYAKKNQYYDLVINKVEIYFNFSNARASDTALL